MNGTPHGKQPSAELDDDYPFITGPAHRPITTTSFKAQVWFDRGHAWAAGFQYEEAVKCFQLAIEADEDCAMAYWGAALSSGPHYNFGWEAYAPVLLSGVVKMTHEYAIKAKEKVQPAHYTSVEKELIDALQARYPQSEQPTDDFSKWNRAFADAMQGVYKNHSDDLDVTACYVGSLMQMTPWKLWEPGTQNPAKGSQVLEIMSVLELALKRPDGRKHAELLHQYIHVVEMSAKPELAIRAADDLRRLLSDRGHLNHMPSHIDLLVGDYRNAVTSNQAAIDADERYVSKCSSTPGAIFSLYSLHNHHSLVYAATLAAQYHTAMDAVVRLEALVPETLLRIEEPGRMVDFAEMFTCVRSHVLIRFGKWEEILALAFPKDQELYCSLLATLHYAKGLAHAALGHIAEAENHFQLLIAAKGRVPESRYNLPGRMIDCLEVGVAMLTGELAYRKGKMDTAFTNLRKAVELDDKLPFGEPAAWMVPTRHALAALLLEEGQIIEAAEVYAADLGLDHGTLPRSRQHPSNVWALHGFHECLVKLNRTAEANLIKSQLNLAMAAADVSIESSCFCRRDAGTKTCC